MVVSDPTGEYIFVWKGSGGQPAATGCEIRHLFYWLIFFRQKHISQLDLTPRLWQQACHQILPTQMFFSSLAWHLTSCHMLAARSCLQHKTHPAPSTPPLTPTIAHQHCQHCLQINPGQIQIELMLFYIITHPPVGTRLTAVREFNGTLVGNSEFRVCTQNKNTYIKSWALIDVDNI